MFRRVKRMLAAIIVASMLVSTIPYSSVCAKTTQEKLDDAKREAEEAQGKVDQAQEEVDNLNARKRNLEKKMKELKAKLEALFEKITDLENRIAIKEAEIQATEDALAEARQVEAEQYAAMKKRIQFMYQDSSSLYLDIIFRAKSFSDFLTLNNYVDSLASYDRKKFEEYGAIRTSIEELDAKLQDEKIELDGLKAEAEEERNNVQGVIDETSDNISEYKDLISEAERVALEYEKELEEKQNTVEALKKQLEEEERLRRLAASLAWRSINDVTFDAGDRYRLAILIYCEAGGEPYEGQVAVGAVVINRVLSGAFPNTVEGVIRQPWQFSPVASGRYDYYYSIGKTTQSCYNAADAAMSGYTNVENCLFFRTPIDGYNARFQIGHHVFK